MKLSLLVLTAASVASAGAFSAHSVSRPSRTSTSTRGSTCSTSTATASATARHATVIEQQETETELVKPKTVAELMSQTDATMDLYGINVQKTYGRYPLTIKNGKGCMLYTTDGKEYLDCVAGIATCVLGHSNTELTHAVTAQMEQVHHVSNLYFIPTQAALANWLCENSVADKVFFCNSGAEANEAAIKCARKHAYNRGITKPVIITAEQSFHGRTLATVTATGQPKYQKGFGYDGAMVQGFKYVKYNDIASLEQAVKEVEESGQGLAGIMMETLQGEGGIVTGSKEYFAKVRQLCDDSGALMICDEVQVGMGRSGKLWGYQNVNIEPDVFTSAKALGGGVPIGAMMCRGAAAEVFGPGDHASTYGGNPLACAAGLAVANYMCEHDLLANVRDRGDQLSAGLEVLAQQYPALLGSVRGWGLLKGVEVVDDAILPGVLVQAAMDNGLLLVAAGKNVVRFVPPLIITEAEIDLALKLFGQAVAQIAKTQVKHTA